MGTRACVELSDEEWAAVVASLVVTSNTGLKGPRYRQIADDIYAQLRVQFGYAPGPPPPPTGHKLTDRRD